MMNKEALMPYSIFEEYIELDFAGRKYSSIKDHGPYLRIVYGDDYMEVPTEKRVVPFVDVIDCNKCWKEFVEQKIDKQQ